MSEQKAEWGVSGGWNGRGTLQELVNELNRQKDNRVDFTADTRDLRVQVREQKEEKTLLLASASPRAAEWIPTGGAPIMMQALEQMGGRVNPEVPVKFTKAMAALRPQRLADLFNGLNSDEPSRRFVRCLDGRVRAFLSDRYRVLDNYDIAFAALDAVRASGGEVVEASLSDTHMRIKFTSRDVWDAIDVKRMGDKGSWYSGGLGSQEYLTKVAAKSGGNLPGGPGTVHPLVTISNSETGHGGFNVRIGILLGERLSVGIFSEATLSQESKTIYMKARDAVKSAFNKDVFKRMVDLARAAQAREIKAPQAAVENVAKANAISDKAKDALLSYFIRDYDMTNYGLAQAVARLAQDGSDGDKAAELEAAAGSILRLQEAVA